MLAAGKCFKCKNKAWISLVREPYLHAFLSTRTSAFLPEVVLGRELNIFLEIITGTQKFPVIVSRDIPD
eukprot:1150130-Pelagomonas_calceolata.AAC.10